jgi:pyruvate/2-oxoglutarate dehydrogenase complex dihydrolipoamide dehydrogenase (E3) component
MLSLYVPTSIPQPDRSRGENDDEISGGWNTDQVLGAHMVGKTQQRLCKELRLQSKWVPLKDFDATTAIHPSAAEEFVTMR